MKIKLDENIGRRGLELLLAAGHDASTVPDQGLGGVADERLFAICAGEGRALITLDHDFGQVTRFPPEQGAGVVVPELGPHATVQAIMDRLADFLAVLENTVRRWFALDRRALVAFGSIFGMSNEEE